MHAHYRVSKDSPQHLTLTTQYNAQCLPELTKDKAVRLEQLAMWSGTHTVHGARLQVYKDGPGHILALIALVVVHINAFQLQVHEVLVHTTRVLPCGLDAMFITDDLPKLKAGAKGSISLFKF